MNQKYCLDKKEWKEAQAALLLAKQLGLIEDAGIGALEKRRAEKMKKQAGRESRGIILWTSFLHSGHVSSI